MSDLDTLRIDWAQPWFEPYREVGAQTLGLIQSGRTAHAALNAVAQPNLRPADAGCFPNFVTADALPPGQAYEAHIHATRSVPTRHNVHDFFNGLVWLVHPALKWRLNALQGEYLAQHGVQAQRGPLRDALTLFDENGALLVLPDGTSKAVREHRWHEAFVVQRDAWHPQACNVVGHALLEKLAQAPRRNLTAHALMGSHGVIAMTAADWALKPFAPLPVMGVPGWHAGQDAAFYGDAEVFRLKVRTKTPDKAD